MPIRISPKFVKPSLIQYIYVRTRIYGREGDAWVYDAYIDLYVHMYIYMYVYLTRGLSFRLTRVFRLLLILLILLLLLLYFPFFFFFYIVPTKF